VKRQLGMCLQYSTDLNLALKSWPIIDTAMALLAWRCFTIHVNQ
jgi:hypothetical protein